MFRSEDINALTTKLNDYKEELAKIQFTNFEPSPDIRKNVYIAILDYIKRNDKIIYGGWAQNALIGDKNPKDQFYTEYNMGDIEFYSHEPIVDLMKLCDELHSLKFQYVQGTDAEHENSYKLFIEFINFCDITLMPKNICDNLPVKIINGIKYADPLVIAVDFYRMFNNPMTALRLWDKTVLRSTFLFKYYPISESIIQPLIKLNLDEKLTSDILTFIRKNIIHKSKLIVVGFYTYNYFIKKVPGFEKYLAKEPYYEIISTNYKQDRDKIYGILKKEYGNKIHYDEFYPFFQFFGKKTVYFYNNKPILILYHDNDVCTVHRYSEQKTTYFGTYLLTLMYMLINFTYSYVFKLGQDKEWINLYSIMEKAKDKYLETNKKTAVDDTPFQHFTLNCLGNKEDPRRNNFLKIMDKKKKNLKLRFRYEPGNNSGKVPNFTFQDISGTKINKN
jgi:hypothetical protein